MSITEEELKKLQRWAWDYVGGKPAKPLPAPVAALIGVPLTVLAALGGLYLLVQIVKFAWLH